MILVAGGDSFTFGSELKDQRGPSPSNLTYPALLSQQNNLSYKCVAQAGAANNGITRLVLAECEHLKKQNFAVIITWTFPNRYEFRFNYNTGQRYSPWFSINSWTTYDDINKIENEYRTKNEDILNDQKKQLERAKKTGVADFAKSFFMHVGDNEYYELYSTFREILFLQNYLEINHIPYMFMAANNTFYDHPNYLRQQDVYLDGLCNQILWDKWFFFEPGKLANETIEPRGFYQWAVENKYPIGATHPLEEAHSAAAELIKDKFNELVTKPLEQNSIRNQI